MEFARKIIRNSLRFAGIAVAVEFVRDRLPYSVDDARDFAKHEGKIYPNRNGYEVGARAKRDRWV